MSEVSSDWPYVSIYKLRGRLHCGAAWIYIVFSIYDSVVNFLLFERVLLLMARLRAWIAIIVHKLVV